MTGQPPALQFARKSKVWHHVTLGRLIITATDLETTDKEWRTAEITAAALSIYDLSLNRLGKHYLMTNVPDRTTFAPEAALITRYRTEHIRNRKNDPPQIVIGKIHHAIKDSPDLLWEKLGEWAELYPDLIDEKDVLIPGRTGKLKKVKVRHLPLTDDEGNIVRHVRVHEGSKKISYLADAAEKADYSDDNGNWKVKARANTIGRLNLGYNNISFDNRVLAAAAHRANISSKEIFFMNRRGLGNDAADVLTMALASHFFSLKGRERIALGKAFNYEISEQRISAKLDEIMDRNARTENPELGISEGVRVGNGTRHNRKKGHNDPDYDNDKAIGLYAYLREHETDLIRQIELCADVEHLRSYMTQDRTDKEFGEDTIEADKRNGYPVAHPLRCIITSRDSRDGEIYEAIPVIVVGTDVRHGDFNRVLCMRADIDYRSYRYKGKSLLEMSSDDIKAMMAEQNRKPGAIFHEHHLKKGHKAAFGIETGLKAGLAPGMDVDQLAAIRDYVAGYVDDHDRLFADKVLDAYRQKHPFWYEADKIANPYPEEEIYTNFMSNKYFAVETADGRKVELPKVISARIHERHNNHCLQIGDTLKRILKPQPVEWKHTLQAAKDYVTQRDKVHADLNKYQRNVWGKERIQLPPAMYDPDNIQVEDVMATLWNDRLRLMDKVFDPSKSPEIQQLVDSGISGDVWQRIPHDVLVSMPEHELTNLDDNGKLRVVFEENPALPTYRYALRMFADAGLKGLLSQSERDFLKAETDFYVHGLPYEPDPEKQRIASAQKALKRIEEIRNNLRLGKKHLAAARDFETGIYQIFAEEPQLAEEILNSLEKDCHRRMKAHVFDDKDKLKMGFDPATGEPILKVKYEIPRSDYVVVRVPDRLLEQPAKDMRLGHTCVLVPDDERIRKARHIVLQGAQTGRTFYAGEPVLHERPTGRSFDRLNDAINNGFVESDMQKPVGGLVLACAEIAPVALTDTSILPDIKVPQQTITASVAPRLAYVSNDAPLRGVALRKYDLDIKAGMVARLRGTDEEGKLTGEEIPVQITKVTTLSLTQMIQKIRSGKLTDQDAVHHGFAHTEDMRDKLTRLFTKFDEDVTDKDNTIVFMSYEPLHNQIDYRTEHGPRSCFNRFSGATFVPPVIDFPDYRAPVPTLKLVMG